MSRGRLSVWAPKQTEMNIAHWVTSTWKLLISNIGRSIWWTHLLRRSLKLTSLHVNVMCTLAWERSCESSFCAHTQLPVTKFYHIIVDNRCEPIMGNKNDRMTMDSGDERRLKWGAALRLCADNHRSLSHAPQCVQGRRLFNTAAFCRACLFWKTVFTSIFSRHLVFPLSFFFSFFVFLFLCIVALSLPSCNLQDSRPDCLV